MPVLPADVVLPTGSLPADWFPTSDIEAWIALGYASVPAEATTGQADGIATAYTYYRGYRARADTVLGTPSSVGGIGSTGLSVAQSDGRYDRLLAQAEAYRVEWEALIVAATPVPEPEPEPLRISRSTASPIVYHWA